MRTSSSCRVLKFPQSGHLPSHFGAVKPQKEQTYCVVGDLVLVGHNIHNFDMKFLYRDARLYWGRTIANDYVDTLPMAKACLPQLEHHKLTDLAQHYNISADGAHRALNDCRMNQQVYECLGREKQKAGQCNCPGNDTKYKVEV